MDQEIYTGHFWFRGQRSEDDIVSRLEERIEINFGRAIKVGRPILWLAVNNLEPLEKSEPVVRNFTAISDTHKLSAA